MLQPQVGRTRSECNWAEIKAQRSPHRPRSSFSLSAAHTAFTAYSNVLPNLIAAGLSLATISFCLGLGETWVLNQAVLQNLPTPSSRPLRRASGKNPWTTHQIQQLILLWPTNLYATCIGQRIDRTPASVRYKARWLGLPQRDRSELGRAIVAKSPLALPVPVATSWTPELGYKIGYRYLRGQHLAGISRDLGLGFSPVSSRTGQIGLEGRHLMGSMLKMDHNPADPVLKKYEDEDWVYKQCLFDPNHWFWAPRRGNRIAPATKKSKAYQDRVASGEGDADGDQLDD